MFVWVVVGVSSLTLHYFEGIADRFGCGKRDESKDELKMTPGEFPGSSVVRALHFHYSASLPGCGKKKRLQEESCHLELAKSGEILSVSCLSGTQMEMLSRQLGVCDWKKMERLEM